MASRKKPRSAAQKAATRKLVALNKHKTRKTPVKRRKTTKSRKPNKARKRSKTVAKRKTVSRKKKGLLGNIPLINNPMFKRAAQGVGTATLGAAALSLILPQFASNPIVKPVLALAGGGAVGAVAQVLTQGGLSGLGLGGGGNNASSGTTINTGFA